MKKIITLILALVMITAAIGAVAEDTATSAPPGTQQTQQDGDQSTGQNKTTRHRQPGMKGRGQQQETDPQPDAGQPTEQKRSRRGKGSGESAQADSQSTGKHGRRSRSTAPTISQTPATDPAAVTVNTIDFDAMAAKGVITQTACDRIKAYTQEHAGSTLNDLLSAGIITQAEYDALIAAQGTLEI